MTSLTSPHVTTTLAQESIRHLLYMLYGKYDVIDLSEIRGLFLKSTDSPVRFCKPGHFAMFQALYLRLTGSVLVPVKNVVFLMLRTLTRLSILNQRSFPLSARL